MVHNLLPRNGACVFLCVFSALRYRQPGRVFYFCNKIREAVSIDRTVNRDEFSSKGAKLPPTEQEQKLLEILRRLDYGEVRIIVKNGAPVHIEEIKKSIKL